VCTLILNWFTMEASRNMAYVAEEDARQSARAGARREEARVISGRG
jgi:hypothetical protein